MGCKAFKYHFSRIILKQNNHLENAFERFMDQILSYHESQTNIVF